VAQIKQVIETYGLDPGGLALEITEDVLMEDTATTFSKITQILGLGVEIHMDDFGTGYSSLAALHNFPISALKIAREFIIEIGSSEGQSEVVRTIISLARIMNIRVIGEGVENAL
jgi:EAL domain-containing protein (putative c-di-GMP-specific phosphodiesterase class I)